MRLALALLLGCGSRAATPPPQPPSNVAAAPTGSVAAAPSAAIQSSADYTARNEALLRDVVAMMGSAECAAIAVAFSAFVDAHRDELVAVRDWEKAHTDEDNAFDNAHQADEKVITDAVGRCAGDAAFAAAVGKLPQ